MSSKPILQSESSECGLACLAMAAGAHGLHVSVPELRQRFPVSLKGARLGQLIHVAQQLGLQARALRLDLQDLPKLTRPCILHWDLTHFVVLAGLRRGKAIILDPASGERRLSLEEFSRHFTGVALELAPAPGFLPRKAPPAVSFRALLGSVRGLRRAVASLLALSLSLQLFVILAPMLMQWIVDQVLVAADRDLLTVLGIGFVLALVLQVGTAFLRGRVVIWLSSRLGLQWTGNVFAHLLRLPLQFFERRHLGDIVSRLGSVQAIQRLLTTAFVETVIDGLMAVVTLALMLAYSWKLALATLLAVGVYLTIRLACYRSARDRTEQQLVAAARQQTCLLESLRGIQSLKIAGNESQRRSAHANLMVETVNHEMRLAHFSLGFGSASQLVFGCERIAVIWMGAGLAMGNVFSVGMLIAYLAYRDQFSQRVAALVDRGMELRMLRLHGERLADIVLTAPEDRRGPGESVQPLEARIQVEGLSYRYSDDEPWVLRSCSFNVEPGESVAIIGASGCGKTTLMKVLLGLARPGAGHVRVGGQDMHSMGLRNLASFAAAVMQDDQLFAGSIADNISAFDPDVDQARVESAARLAAIHDAIAAMPMGYHSLIGDMGSLLSGGQKQRLLLARALYRNPRILILDEATSHLDVVSERLVSAAVRKLQLTTLIVAHRPETIAAADRVLVMDGGRIVQEMRNKRGIEAAGAA
jgi:ATP-binding cassette subfamily B protein RaxB